MKDRWQRRRTVKSIDHPISELFSVSASVKDVRVNIVPPQGCIILARYRSHIPRTHYILSQLLNAMVLVTSLVRVTFAFASWVVDFRVELLADIILP
jgi:hypothetical protein